MKWPAGVDTYPNKEQVANFLRDYAAAFELPVRLNARVPRLQRMGDGFEIATTGGDLWARQVVVATGPFQVPFVPPLAGGATHR
jgi:putative flavoprotein involved in K+ transport